MYLTDTSHTGTEEELNTPEIQQLIIQHGYKEELIELGVKLQ